MWSSSAAGSSASQSPATSSSTPTSPSPSSTPPSPAPAPPVPGYIWMVHLTPGSDTWELSMRSRQLWEELVESIERQGLNPLDELGWKKTGSLLIGRTSEELAMLEGRAELLSKAGLKVEFLSAPSLLSKEPALEVGGERGAAFLPDDFQLDAFRTVAFLEKGNKHFACSGRYAEFYNNPAISLIRSEKNGSVEGIQTEQNILYCKQALVVATGAWTGSFMQSLITDSDILLRVPVKPRKALGTAEMVGDMILDNPGKVNCAPFSVQGRFVN